MEVRPLRDDERDWVRARTRESWTDETVVAHGVVYHPHTLPGFVAVDDDGERVGLVTFTIDGSACEIVTLAAWVEGSGHGRAMVEAVSKAALAAGHTRLWLVTTNDNERALGFYRALGFDVAVVREGAIVEARKLKPSIPFVSEDGVPITDEIELERRLR
jgi:ribosomal protein S18 acetylase RimI-like enzyme